MLHPHLYMNRNAKRMTHACTDQCLHLLRLGGREQTLEVEVRTKSGRYYEIKVRELAKMSHEQLMQYHSKEVQQLTVLRCFGSS